MFAEAWRLGRRCVFWWQARRLQHLSILLCGWRGPLNTSIDVCGSVAPGTPRRFLVAGATLAAPQHPFAWLAAAFCGGRRNACSTSASFRGRRGVFSPSIDVCGSVAPGTPPRFVVPGVILAATQPRFAWTAWRFQYEHRCVRKCGGRRGVFWW